MLKSGFGPKTTALQVGGFYQLLGKAFKVLSSLLLFGNHSLGSLGPSGASHSTRVKGSSEEGPPAQLERLWLPTATPSTGKCIGDVSVSSSSLLPGQAGMKCSCS